MTKPYLICCDIQIPIDKTLPYNFCWDIQTPTAKDSSVSKWFQRWQNLTSFAGTFKFKMKKAIQYAKWFQRWQNLTFIAGTFKLKLIEPCIPCWDIQIPTEKDSSLSKWLQRWHNLTFFVGTFKFQLKKTVQYRNDFKDDRILHPLQEHLSSKWKRQFSMQNDFKDDRTLHLSLGHSN